VYKIDLKSKVPLHTQLYNELKNDIIENLQVGEKLPSIRKMVDMYNLSKTTVQNAYMQLYAEGYVESYPKSGYFVSDINYSEFNTNTKENPADIREYKEYLYDFSPARLHKSTFPTKTFKRVMNKTISDELDFGKYNDGQGEEGLRKEIIKYLASSRGVNAHYDQVVITSGFSESLNIITRLFQKDISDFAIENPGYRITKIIFEAFGYSVYPIDTNSDGIDIEKLYESNARIVYLTPSHQYPKGVTIPIANRLKLLEWARQKDAYIIEDDYDSELSYINKPIPSMQGLDSDGRVIYLGTFSKSLSPAMRLAYMVLPIKQAKAFQNFFDITFSTVSLPIQKAMEIFLQEGYYDRHLRKIRTLNKKKHDLMKECLDKNLGNMIRYESYGGGLSLVVNPTIPFEMEKLKQEIEKEKLKISFISKDVDSDFEAIRLGFGGFLLEDIPKAIECFSSIWMRCCLEKL
jgi:GntR family transcriptional regulator/MocR family aminotransferase